MMLRNFQNKMRFVLLLLGVLSVSVVSHAQEGASRVNADELLAENRSLTDEVITLAIERELLASKAVEGDKIEVKAKDGVVTLFGEVEHLLAEQVAITIAQRVRGVVSVVDLVEIVTDRRPDIDLVTDVEAALATDPATHDLQIKPAVSEGLCTLSGAVPSTGEKMLAERVAAGVVGVLEIKNELTLDRGEKLPDPVLKSEIAELLQYSVLLDNAQIDVEVKSGNAVLTGTVSSDYLRSQAAQLAYRARAHSVDTKGIRVTSRHSNRDLREARYEKVTDEKVITAIQRAWSYDPRLVGFEPKVSVKHGVATLSGTVGDLPAKQAAERIARYTLGVHKVDNQLQVHWPEETPSDEKIAELAHEALRRDPYVDVKNIKVTCEDSHVGLYGVVENGFEKQHAQWAAGNQVGVVHVDNSLAIRSKWVKKSDKEIETELKDRLSLIFLDPANQVSAKVDAGVALMQGTVDSWYMWQAALDQALAAGAREPHMMIDVRYGGGAELPYYGPHYYIPQ